MKFMALITGTFTVKTARTCFVAPFEREAITFSVIVGRANGIHSRSPLLFLSLSFLLLPWAPLCVIFDDEYITGADVAAAGGRESVERLLAARPLARTIQWPLAPLSHFSLSLSLSRQRRRRRKEGRKEVSR